LRPRGGAFEVDDRGVDSCIGEGFGFEDFPEGIFCNWVFRVDADDFFVVLVGVTLGSRVAVAGVRESVGDCDGFFDFGGLLFLVVLVGLEVQNFLGEFFDNLLHVGDGVFDFLGSCVALLDSVIDGDDFCLQCGCSLRDCVERPFVGVFGVGFQ
jgi:hypothetical protein